MDKIIKSFVTACLVVMLAVASITTVPLMEYETDETNAVILVCLTLVYTIVIFGIEEIWRNDEQI